VEQCDQDHGALSTDKMTEFRAWCDAAFIWGGGRRKSLPLAAEPVTQRGYSIASGNLISRALISKNKPLGECQIVFEHAGLRCPSLSPIVATEPQPSYMEAPSSALMMVPSEPPSNVPSPDVSPDMHSVEVAFYLPYDPVGAPLKGPTVVPSTCHHASCQMCHHVRCHPMCPLPRWPALFLKSCLTQQGHL
jgi:hypothetical protein